MKTHTYVRIDRDACCVTIPVSYYHRDDSPEDVVTAIGRNLLRFRANRAKTRPRRRRRSFLGIAHIPRDSFAVAFLPQFYPLCDARQIIFHAFFSITSPDVSPFLFNYYGFSCFVKHEHMWLTSDGCYIITNTEKNAEKNIRRNYSNIIKYMINLPRLFLIDFI